MPAIAVIGLQRGDEGKGKVIDILTEFADYLIRFQGGNNAGHTIYVRCGETEEKIVLHLLGSGVARDCILGQTSGVVNDLMQLDCEVKEVNAKLHKELRQQLRLDERVMLLMPYHRFGDFAIESHLQRTSGSSVGSTGRGIKPAYIDEVEGREIRFFDLADKDKFARKVRDNAKFWARKINALYCVSDEEFRSFGDKIATAEHRAKEKDAQLVTKDILNPCDFDYARFMKQWVGFDSDAIIDAYYELYMKFADCVCDLSSELNSELIKGKTVVFEGAQGAILDKTWAYGHNRTHSNTITGAISTSAGISPMHITRIIGVAKAYGTAVGTHVIPTQMDDDDLAKRLMTHEFGSSTGRQRLVYWLNLPEDRISARITGVTELVINKLDLLTGAESLKICTELVDGDKVYETAPPDLDVIRRCKPRYSTSTFRGWKEDISGCRSFDELPQTAQEYVGFYVGQLRKINPDMKLSMVGVSKKRDGVIRVL